MKGKQSTKVAEFMAQPDVGSFGFEGQIPTSQHDVKWPGITIFGLPWRA